MLVKLVPSKTVNFPSLCPKCLGKNDLTTYTSKWKQEYRVDVITRVTEKAQIKIPICKSCKKAIVGETRKKYAKYFAISTPICWGLLYLFFVYGIHLMEQIPVEIGKYILVIVIAFLAFIPLYNLYYTIIPFRVVKWPVKLEGPNTFSIENETYAKLFQAANHSS